MRERRFVTGNCRRSVLVVRRAEGVYTCGAGGRKFLDFVSGIGVMALGNAHPRVVPALHEQLETLMHCPNLYCRPPHGEGAERLVSLGGLQRAFLCNSGADAIETALKMAKGHGRDLSPREHEIVGLRRAFGGRTLGARSVTERVPYTEPLRPFLPGVRFVAPNDFRCGTSLGLRGAWRRPVTRC